MVSNTQAMGGPEMKVLCVNGYEVYVVVTADDACLLSKACDIAIDEGMYFGSKENQPERDCLWAMGAAFKALAIAAMGQWSMCPANLDSLDEFLVEQGLRPARFGGLRGFDLPVSASKQAEAIS